MAILSATFLSQRQNVVVLDANQIHGALANATSLINIIVAPNAIFNSAHYNISRATKFEYIDFSRSQFESITFKNCTFITCRFLKSQFKACNFHNCFFHNCDFRYSTFFQTSVNPNRISNSIDFKTENNVGADILGKLIGSLKDDNNRDYIIDAQYLYRIYRRKWRLIEGKALYRDYRSQGKKIEAIGTYVRTKFNNWIDWLYWFIAQYGFKV